jgi:hypothetical protein
MRHQMGGENQAQQGMTLRKIVITKHGCEKHFQSVTYWTLLGMLTYLTLVVTRRSWLSKRKTNEYLNVNLGWLFVTINLEEDYKVTITMNSNQSKYQNSKSCMGLK